MHSGMKQKGKRANLRYRQDTVFSLILGRIDLRGILPLDIYKLTVGLSAK